MFRKQFIFEDVKVPARNTVGKEGEAYKQAMANLERVVFHNNTKAKSYSDAANTTTLLFQRHPAD